MPNNQISLNYTEKIDATRESVFYMITKGFDEWLCNHAEAKPFPGGYFFLWWQNGYWAAGTFEEIIKNTSIRLNWQGYREPYPTKIEISLAYFDGKSEISLTHSGIGVSDDWKQTIEQFDKGWKIGFENLKKILETGYDPRIYDIPIIGVYVSDIITLDDEKSKHYPVDHGLLLGNTVDGSGASKAGLQKHDLITKINGVEILGKETISESIRKMKVGEEVEITFYRGDEKKSTCLPLSGRPRPELPSSSPEIADRVQNNYQKIYRMLDRTLNNITEEEALFKPTPAEWNVNEILAHLIYSDYFNQDVISGMIMGEKVDIYTGQLYIRLKPILESYPTYHDLLSTLKITQAGVVKMILELPIEITNRKNVIASICENQISGTAIHYKEHIEQMQSNLLIYRGE